MYTEHCVTVLVLNELLRQWKKKHKNAGKKSKKKIKNIGNTIPRVTV